MMHPDRVAGAEAVPLAQIHPADQGLQVAVPACGGRTQLAWGRNRAGGDPSPCCFSHTLLASRLVVVLRPHRRATASSPRPRRPPRRSTRESTQASASRRCAKPSTHWSPAEKNSKAACPCPVKTTG